VRGLVAYAGFEVGRLARSWKFLIITVGFPVVFYMLFLSDHSRGSVIDGTVAWPVYLMVSMCSFGSLVAGLTAGGARLAAERASGWARQLRVTPIPAWSYVAIKVTASMLVILPVIVLVEIVGATFGNVSLPAGTWVALTVVMWITALPFAVLGVLIGFLVHTETAFPVITALMFVLGYFGGLFKPVSTLPTALREAAQALPSYHNSFLGVTVIDGHGVGAAHWLVLVGYAAVLASAVIVRHRHEENRGLA
jgi:ABC-2 type transport system permease protein